MAQGQVIPAIGDDVTALMGGVSQSVPPVGADVTHLMSPTFKTSNQVDENGQPIVDPNTLGTFMSHAGAQVNPIAAVQTVANALPIPKAVGGAGMDAPWQTVKNIGAAHGAVFDKAKAAFNEGDYISAGRHFMDFLIPVVGPVLDKSADQMQAGKYAAGVGDAVGLALAMFAGKPLGEALSAVKAKMPGLLKNPNAVEAAAVQFGRDNEIPVDSGTASGRQFVKNLQKKAGSTWGGAATAESAKAAQAEGLTRVGEDLAARADPAGGPATLEQAGTEVRGATTKLVSDLNAQATQAYDKLRAIEADPVHAKTVESAPRGSAAEKVIRKKLAAGSDSGAPPSDAELGVMRQIEAELDAIPYKAGKLVEAVDDAGGTSHYDPRSAGAPVYHEIGQATGLTQTRAETLAGIRKTLETGDWTPAAKGALEVAQKRLRNSGSVTGPQLRPGTPLLGTTSEVALPVGLSGTKAALKPLYERLASEHAIVPLMGDKGRALVALTRLMDAPAHAPLSVVDAALGDLKAMARADIPELRTQGQATAAQAVKALDAAVRATATKAGPDVIGALEEGRGATIAKHWTGDVLEQLNAEPVKLAKQLLARQDSGIELLRKVREAAPEQVQKLSRAYLDELMNTATESGGFSHADKIYADWQKLGDSSKKILFDSAHVKDLDRFFLLAKKLSENPNPSGTAQVLSATQIVAGIPSWALAKILYNPKAVPLLNRGLALFHGPARLAPKLQATGYADIVNAASAAGVPSSLVPAFGQDPATGATKQ